MVMVRGDTLNSSRSPLLMPAWRCTLGGTKRPLFSLTVICMTWSASTARIVRIPRFCVTITASMAILDINEIRAILPHRYPFLLVDRIVELEAERIVGIKNVTHNEPFFTGHFPDFPVMP